MRQFILLYETFEDSVVECSPVTIMTITRTHFKYIVQIGFYVALLCIYVKYYLEGEIDAYVKARTTFASTFEEALILKYPTLTFCMEPPTKFSVAKKYNFTSVYDKFSKDVPNATLHQTFDELSYILNKDFYITNTNTDEKLKLGMNVFVQVKAEENLKINRTFNVQPIRTYDNGVCYTVSPTFELDEVPMRMFYSVTLSPTLESKDQPKGLYLFFLDNNTWLGLVDSTWPQFKPTKEYIDFSKEYTAMYLNAREKIYRDGVEDNVQCMTDVLSQYDHCDTKCDIVSHVHHPVCNTSSQLKCIWDKLWADNGYTNCIKTNKATDYRVERVDQPLHFEVNLTTTDIYIGLWSMIKEIQEEILILSLPDMIGSVGGSLSLFFGVTMSAPLMWLVNKVFDQCFTHNKKSF